MDYQEVWNLVRFLSTVNQFFFMERRDGLWRRLFTKQLDGCCAKMLRMALNVPWQSHTTNRVLYGDLPKVLEKVRQRRRQLLVIVCVTMMRWLVIWCSGNQRREEGKELEGHSLILMLLEWHWNRLCSGAEDRYAKSRWVA